MKNVWKKLCFGILVCLIAVGLAAQQVEIYPQMGPHGNSRTSFSPDGRWILSGTIWDASTGRELQRPFNGSIIGWSPDMKRYLEGTGNTVRVRDWETDAIIITLRNIHGSTGSRTVNIAFSPDGRQIAAITSDSRNIKVWDASNGQELITITTDPESFFYNFCYSPDGRTIVFRDSRTVKVFDLVNRRQLRSFPVADSSNSSNTFSNDGRRYMVTTSTETPGNYRETITIYDTETGRVLRTLTGYNSFVIAMAYRPDGRQIVSVARDNVMKVWDAETGRELRSINLTGDYIASLAFSPDGRRLVLNPSSRLIVLDTNNYREVLAIKYLENILYSPSTINVNFLNENQALFQTRENIHLLNMQTGRRAWTMSTITPTDTSFRNVYFSPDRRFFAKTDPPTRATRGAFTINIYDTDTGRLIRTWQNNLGADGSADELLNSWGLVWSQNGRELISYSMNVIIDARNGTASAIIYLGIWNVTDGRLISSHRHEPRATSGQIHRARNFSESYFNHDINRVIYLTDDSLQVYETRGTRRLITINGNFNRARWSPDGSRIITTTENSIIRIWDAQNGREITGAPRHERLRQIEYSPNGRQIITFGEDGFIRAWNTANNTQLWEYNVRDNRLERLYYNADGTRIIAVTYLSNAVRILDSANGRLLFSQTERIASISPDGKWIITVSRDGRVRIWNAETNVEKAQFIAFDNGGWLSMTPDGYYVASARGDQQLNARVGNTVTGIDRYRSTFNKPDIVAARLSNTGSMTHNEAIVSVSVNPTGTRIASVSQNTIKIWELESGRELHRITNIGGNVNAISWSPDGRRLIHGAEDNTIRIWNAETGAAISTISGHTAYVNEARYSPDGRRIASCADDKLIKIWDAGTGREIRTLSGHTDSVGPGVIAWSPNGRRLASGSIEEERTIRIWDAQSGRVLRTIPDQGGRIMGLAFSPDGRRLASCTPGEQEVKIWDAESGRLIRSIPLEETDPYSLAWSPDGNLLAIGSIDESGGYIDIFDTNTAINIRRIWARGITQSLTWTPDSRRIVSTINFSDIQMIKVFNALSGRELY